MEDEMNFGECLRASRLAAKLSQEDVAKVVGVAQPTVANWECGNSRPCRISFKRIAELFPVVGERFEANDFKDTLVIPIGRKEGNPGKRSAEVRANMSAGRIAAVGHRVVRELASGEVIFAAPARAARVASAPKPKPTKRARKPLSADAKIGKLVVQLYKLLEEVA
jgi:transcriptional regulator with XRE-family HTH domain